MISLAGQKCVIYRCNSNSTNGRNIRFFRFPTSDTTDYKIWMSICRDSREKIRSLENPLVCSLHFAPEEIGQQRLHPNAFPRLNLPEEYYAAQDEIEQKVDCIGNITREWIIRSQCYHNISRKTVGDVTRWVRELLNIPRNVPNPLWIREFKYQPILPDGKGMMNTARPLKKSDVIAVIRDIINAERRNKPEQQTADSILNLPVKNESKSDEDVIPRCEAMLDDFLETKGDEDDADERTIDSYEDALEYLKPLQYYVNKGKEHVAAIGLLTQLQAIFRNPEDS